MAAREGCLVLVTVFLVLRLTESCGPSVNFPPITVKETDPAGHMLLNITMEAGVTWTLNARGTETMTSDPALLEWLRGQVYISSRTEDNVHDVLLKAPLDLELVYQRYRTKLSTVTYQLVCSEAGNSDTTFELILMVEPVNEFEPTFISPPLNITISESAEVKKELIRLRDNATDQDVVRTGDSDIHEFSMTMKPLPWSELFTGVIDMVDKQDGKIALTKPIDFEAFPAKNRAFLNYEVTVWDMGRKHSSTQLTINVEDVDDEPPYFYYPGCTPTPCEVYYVCEVAYDFTGMVTNMSPANIMAHDGDSLTSDISYYIKTGPESPRFRRFVSIDPNTGILSVKQPLGAYSTSEIVLVIQAEEMTPKKQTKETTVIVKISYPNNNVPAPTTTTTPRTTAASADLSLTKSVLIAVVVLFVIVILAFVGFGVLLVFWKKRPDKNIYPADEEGLAEDSPQSPTLHRTGSSRDSGQWSMNGGTLTAPPRSRRDTPTSASHVQARVLRAQQEEEEEEDGVGRPVARPKSKKKASAKGKRSATAKRADTPQVPPTMELGDMYGMYPDGAMALVHAQMHNMALNGYGVLEEQEEGEEEEEAEVASGQPSKRQYPKSAPPGPSSSGRSVPKRPATSRKARKDKAADSSVEEEF